MTTVTNISSNMYIYAAGRTALAGPTYVVAIVYLRELRNPALEYDVMQHVSWAADKPRKELEELIEGYDYIKTESILTPQTLNIDRCWDYTVSKRIRLVINNMYYLAKSFNFQNILCDNYTPGSFRDETIRLESPTVYTRLTKHLGQYFRQQVINNSYHPKFKEFRWDKNGGYDSEEHLQRILEYGITHYHIEEYLVSVVPKYWLRQVKKNDRFAIECNYENYVPRWWKMLYGGLAFTYGLKLPIDVIKKKSPDQIKAFYWNHHFIFQNLITLP